MNLDFFDEVADILILKGTWNKSVNEASNCSHLVVIKMLIILDVFENVFDSWETRFQAVPGLATKLREYDQHHVIGTQYDTGNGELSWVRFSQI